MRGPTSGRPVAQGSSAAAFGLSLFAALPAEAQEYDFTMGVIT